MKSHLGLDAGVKPETVPEETVLAVAEVLRRSPVLRVSEDGKLIPAITSVFLGSLVYLPVAHAKHLSFVADIFCKNLFPNLLQILGCSILPFKIDTNVDPLSLYREQLVASTLCTTLRCYVTPCT